MTSFRIGIDVGGTFTDLVAIDRTGATVFAKSPSTPEDQSLGVLAGLDELARRLGLGLREITSGVGILASDEGSAMRAVQNNASAFQRPVVVDWNQGKAGECYGSQYWGVLGLS